MTEEQRIRYQSTLKHPDTEEHIDLWFYRPIGFRVALLGERLGWTPNMISVASIFLGIGCGLLCYPSDWRWNLLGFLLLVLADICDSADGQLARMTRQFSRLGRILDGACGDIWFISIYASICLRLWPEWGWWIWVLAAATGFCHSKQAAMADYYRNFHLFFVKGKSGSELDDARQVAEDYRKISFRKEPVYKLFLWFYRNYTIGQERWTPRMQGFRQALRTRFWEQPIDPALAEAFRTRSLPLMKYTNILSFNCRSFVLCASLMVGMPWLYFAVEITIGNLLLACMMWRHERICREMTEWLQGSGPITSNK